MNITRLQGNYLIKQYIRKGQKHLPKDYILKRKLYDFQIDYLGGRDIDILYSSVAILIRTHSLNEWTKHEHELFCKAFDVILNNATKVEQYQPMNTYRLTLEYLYVPSFYNEDHNEFNSIDFDKTILCGCDCYKGE